MGKVPTPRRSIGRVSSNIIENKHHVQDHANLVGDNNLTSDNLLRFKEEILDSLSSIQTSKKEYGAILLTNVIFSNKKRLEDYLEGKQTLGNQSPRTSSLDVLSVFGDITRSLCPLLVDPEISVRSSASESLVSISSLSNSIAEHLVDLDIMTSLEAAVDKLTDNDHSTDKDTPTYLNLCEILNNLCSRSEKAIKILATTSVPAKLVATISQPLEGRTSRHVSSIQLLLTILESTVPIPVLSDRSLLVILVKIVNTGIKSGMAQQQDSGEEMEDEVEKKLLNRLREDEAERFLLTATASLLLVSLVSCSLQEMSQQEIISLHKLVVSKSKNVLETETSSIIRELVRIISETDENLALVMGSQSEVVITDESSTDPGPAVNCYDELYSKSTSLGYYLQAKSVVVETVVKMVQSNDESDDEEEGDDEEIEIHDASESDEDIEVDVDASLPSTATSRDASHSVELEVSDGMEVTHEPDILSQTNLISKMIELLRDPSDSPDGEIENIKILNKLPAGKGILDEWKELRVNTLVGISSIAQNRPDLLIKQRDLEEKIIELISDNEDQDVIRSAIDAMRSLLEAEVFKLSVEHVKVFADIIKKGASSSEASTAIACIKILGFVATQTRDHGVIFSLSSMLLDILEEDDVSEEGHSHLKLLLMAEILDTLMDIFSEDYVTDEVVLKIKLLPRLSSLDKTFCSLIKQMQTQKRNKKSHLKRKDFAVIQTVADNIKRFIRYKAKNIGKKK
jgi:hypothetical protein